MDKVTIVIDEIMFDTKDFLLGLQPNIAQMMSYIIYRGRGCCQS